MTRATTTKVKLVHYDNKKQLQWQNMYYSIDFLSRHHRYRCRHASRDSELLARAIGIKAGKRPTVIDATAGFANDALIIAALGCQVTLLERNNEIVELLKQAFAAAQHDQQMAQLIARMTLIHSDSIHYLRQKPFRNQPDVIYLDPMFPARKKSALVKKEMQILQALLQGETVDSAELLQAAIDCAPKRVVVKRPTYAPPVEVAMPPSLTMKNRSCRFDIYLPSADATPPRSLAEASLA